MSLAEAVKDIADQLEIEADGLSTQGDTRIVKAFVMMLRSALKASEKDKVVLTASDVGSMPTDLFSANSKKVMEKQAAIAAEEAKLAYMREEQGAGSMTELVGGEADHMLVPADPKMPVGAFTCVGQEVYQKREDGRLIFNEEMTNKRRQGK